MSSKNVKQIIVKKTSPSRKTPTEDEAKDIVNEKCIESLIDENELEDVKPKISFDYCDLVARIINNDNNSDQSNGSKVIRIKEELLDDGNSIEIDEPKIQKQDIAIVVPTRRQTNDSDNMNDEETEEDTQSMQGIEDDNNSMDLLEELENSNNTENTITSIETFINAFDEIVSHKDKTSHCSFMEAYGFIMTFRFVYEKEEKPDTDSLQTLNVLLSRYTGIDSLNVLQVFLDALTMTGDLDEFKNVGLQPVDCILLTFLQLKVCIYFKDIAKVFECDEKSAATCFVQTLHKMKKSLGSVIYWPSREETEMTIPKFFKPAYSNVRTIFTNLEVQMKEPYQQRYVIGFAPSGFVSYISNGYNADTHTDEKIFRLEKIRQRFERNQDALMVLNGFPIENLLGINNFRVFRPPFIVKKVLPDNKTIVKENFALFKHVTETCSSLKKFQILSLQLQFPSIYVDEILFSVCVCINYNVMFRNT